MPTQKLLLLLALIVVLGGAAVWYLQVLLPSRSTDDSFTVEGTQKPTDFETGTTSKPTTPAVTKTNTKPTGSVPVTTMDGDFTAINTAADASYDDSSLSAEFTNANANTLTDSYDY